MTRPGLAAALAGLVRDRAAVPPPLPRGAVALAAADLGVEVDGRWLVRGLDLDVHAGEVLAVVGPNGAGKSSLLSLLAGDLTPATGTVRVAAGSVHRADPLTLARHRAVLPQQPRLSFPFTVAEVIAMGRAPWAGTDAEDEDEDAVASAVTATDVHDFLDRRYPTLSGGEQGRVSFARVLAQRTGVLLLDEPTAALDLRHQEELMLTARACARAGCAVLAVLHDLQLAAAHADRVAVLHEGRLVGCGHPDAVFTEALLEDVYGLPLDVFRHPAHGGLIITPRRTAPTPQP